MRTATSPAERPLSALDVIDGRRSVRSYAAKPLEVSTVRAPARCRRPGAEHGGGERDHFVATREGGEPCPRRKQR